MTIMPIFDDLTVDGRADEPPVPPHRRWGHRRRRGPPALAGAAPRPEHATAFGQGCLDDDAAVAPAVDGPGALEATPGHVPDPDPAAAPRLGARRRRPPRAAILRRAASRSSTPRAGRPRRSATGASAPEHLLLAAVRAGGEVGRAFGLRRAGPRRRGRCLRRRVRSPSRSWPRTGRPPTAVAAAALSRARRRAAALGRPCRPPTWPSPCSTRAAPPGCSPTSASTATTSRTCSPATTSSCPPSRPCAPMSGPRGPAPVPVGVLPPVRLMLPAPSDPTAAPRSADVMTPLRIGPPPGSPARRLGRGRVGPAARSAGDPALDLPA